MSSIVLTSGKTRPSLAEVVPNSLAAMRGEAGSLGLPAVRGVVVMLVDGLGAQLLRSRAGHARHLVAGWGSDDSGFSFPSTTVAGITQLTTGQPAGAHGLVAYSVWDRGADEYRNQLSGWGPGMDPATWQLQPTMFEQVPAPQVQSAVISVGEYRDSGLTRASLRGARYLAADSMLERCELAAQFCRKQRLPLVYLYHAELDQAGHRYGCQSDQWLEQLEELDSAFAALLAQLPSDIGVLVVADHGMIDIPLEAQIDLPQDLLTDVAAVAGEPRLRHLYLVTPGAPAAADLAQRLREVEGERAVICTREEAIAAGWYGAQVHPAAAARIGDVIVAATANVTYFSPEMPASQRRMIGQHGSITDAETLVPIVRHGAFRH